eukprot:UN09420
MAAKASEQCIDYRVLQSKLVTSSLQQKCFELFRDHLSADKKITYNEWKNEFLTNDDHHYIWSCLGLVGDKLIGNAIGISFSYNCKRYLLISQVVVHPNYRRNGIAKCLIKHLTQKIPSRLKCERIVIVSSNPFAILAAAHYDNNTNIPDPKRIWRYPIYRILKESASKQFRNLTDKSQIKCHNYQSIIKTCTKDSIDRNYNNINQLQLQYIKNIKKWNLGDLSNDEKYIFIMDIPPWYYTKIIQIAFISVVII